MKYLKMLLLIAIVVVPVSVYAGAKSIDELAKMYDSSDCKGCHAEIYAQWEKSHHARPLMGVKGGLMLVPVVKESAFSPKDKDGKVDPKVATAKNFPCFKCHLPNALDAENSFFAEVAQALLDGNKEKISKLQITCTVCHNTKAILHKRELGEPEKGVIYSSKDNDAHPGGKIKKSAIFTNSLFCGQCHGLGPNLEFDQPFQCANLYGSYLHNYISSGGTKTCQNCHMQKGDHLIAPDWNDEKATVELLGKAISLDVQTVGYDWLRKAGTYVSKVVVSTTITTTAGHRTPDG
ncbi:MAG: cytochrome C [Nitrospirae bacterium]|nr:cytochrome C [Nitrospirota bacterium]